MLETATLGLVEGYTDVVKRERLFLRDLWLVPTLVGRNHWVLFVVLMKQKQVLILDSLGYTPEQPLKDNVKEHLKVGSS